MIPAKGAVHAGQLAQQYDVLHTGSSQKPAAEHGRDKFRRQHISVVLDPYPFNLGLMPVFRICILCSEMDQGHAAEMRVEHTYYPTVSPQLGVPEVQWDMIPAKGAVHAGQLAQQYDVFHTGSSQKPAAEHGRDKSKHQRI